MTDDHLANWLSEYPSLIHKIQHSPELERYLRRTAPKNASQRVDDQTWNQITHQLAQ